MHLVCCIVHACMWHVSIFVYAAYMKTVLIPEINLLYSIKQCSWHSLINNTATLRYIGFINIIM